MLLPACLGVVLLLLADVFEFSWRYQLAAVITLAPAGALGITVVAGYLRSLRGSRPAVGQPVPSAGPADGTWAEPVAGVCGRRHR